MLRREAEHPQTPITTPFAIAASGVATLAGALALYVAAAPTAEVTVVEVPRAIAVPRPIPRLVLVPVPALAPRGPARVGGPIERVAAASGAPVIAIAGGDRVWISRDDGATFAPALAHAGAVTDLFVDAAGAVYAGRNGTLGIATPDGDERWSATPPLDGKLLDATAMGTGHVMFAAEQWGGGTGIALDGDASLHIVVGGALWNTIAAELSSTTEARVLVSQWLGEDHWSAPELHVFDTAGAYEGTGARDRVVWRGRHDDSASAVRSATPCAGLAGDSLWIVERDPDRKAPARLVVVDRDGEPRDVSLAGVDLDADRVTCTITGNPRGAYASFAVDGHAPLAFALDAAVATAARRPGADLVDLRAVDHLGRALGLRDGRVVRSSDDGDVVTLARP